MAGFHVADMKIGRNVQPYMINPPFASAVPLAWQGQSRSYKQKEVAWKTIPCRHFVNGEGKCSHGEYCDFVHDLELHKVLERDREQEKNTTGAEKVSHCWAHVQGRCRKGNCSYLHPADVKPYIPYTPCINWSRCGQTPYCPFQHPEWLYYQSARQVHGKQDQSLYYHLLAAMHGKPMTFGGTTYFPTLNVVKASNWSGTYPGRDGRWYGHVNGPTGVPAMGPALWNTILKNPDGFPYEHRETTRRRRISVTTALKNRRLTNSGR